jgi:hypothetical protein
MVEKVAGITRRVGIAGVGVRSWFASRFALTMTVPHDTTAISG